MRQLGGLLLCWVLLSIPIAGQQNDMADWATVSSLATGTSVEVHRQSKGTVSGTIATVSSATLALTQKNGAAMSIDRQSVTSVYRTEPRHVARAAAIGGLVGAATGAGIGAAVCRAGSNSIGCSRAQGVGVAAPIVGIVGVLIGAAIGSHRNKSLVYHVQN